MMFESGLLQIVSIVFAVRLSFQFFFQLFFFFPMKRTLKEDRQIKLNVGSLDLDSMFISDL